MLDEILISVCISTHNRFNKLKKCIESILKQKYPFIELIVVDDASQDGTSEYLEDLALTNSRLSWMRNNENLGLAASRNRAIKMSKGEWVAFIDDDDVWSEDYLSKVSEKIKHGGEVISCFPGPFDDSELKMPLLDALFLGITPPVSAQCYKRLVLHEIGGYDEEIKSGVDHGLWIKLIALRKPNIVFFCGDYVFPDISSEEGRMTTTWEKRYSGLMNSLNIWEKKYAAYFPDTFFGYFRKAYLVYLVKKFLNLYIKRRKFFSAFGLVIKFPLVFFKVVLGLKKKSENSSIIPLFIPYKGTS